MIKKIEEILGQGPLAGIRTIPGTIPVAGREHWYIEDDATGDFDALFLRVVTAADPPFHKNGGALTGGCELILPDGRKFHAISYKGDLVGWRKQVLYGARKLNLSAIQAVDGSLVLPGNAAIPISECEARFY